MRGAWVGAVAAAVLLGATGARAQTSAPPPSSAVGSQEASPEKIALAKEVFQLVNLKQMIDGISNVMGAVQKSVIANMPAEQQAKADAYRKASNEALMEVLVPRLLDQMAVAYARTFTAAQLRELLVFYKSDAGRALIQNTPALLQSMQPQLFEDMRILLGATVTRYCADTGCTKAEQDAMEARVGALGAALGAR